MREGGGDAREQASFDGQDPHYRAVVAVWLLNDSSVVTQ